jgi:hypothetical protein
MKSERPCAILRHPETDSYNLMMATKRVSDMAMSQGLWNNASLKTVSNAFWKFTKQV